MTLHSGTFSNLSCSFVQNSLGSMSSSKKISSCTISKKTLSPCTVYTFVCRHLFPLRKLVSWSPFR
ncbi:unnamed protein product, partial [Amoebophrya sp. A120]|eukprot:GSA120T00009420001.1